MTSQVELQTTQSVSQATGMRQSLRCVAVAAMTGDSRGAEPLRKAAWLALQPRARGFPTFVELSQAHQSRN
jgi:hypothetical protein